MESQSVFSYHQAIRIKGFTIYNVFISFGCKRDFLFLELLGWLVACLLGCTCFTYQLSLFYSLIY